MWICWDALQERFTLLQAVVLPGAPDCLTPQGLSLPLPCALDQRTESRETGPNSFLIRVTPWPLPTGGQQARPRGCPAPVWSTCFPPTSCCLCCGSPFTLQQGIGWPQAACPRGMSVGSFPVFWKHLGDSAARQEGLSRNSGRLMDYDPLSKWLCVLTLLVSPLQV